MHLVNNYYYFIAALSFSSAVYEERSASDGRV